MFKKSLTIALFTFFVATTPAYSAPDGDKARAFIQTLADKTLKILSPTAPKNDRINKMIPLLKDNMASPLISRAVMGANYRLLQDNLATQYNAIFPEWASLNVATKLGGINLKSFTVQNIAIGKRDVTVRSVVIDGKGSKITADWRVRDMNGTLKVIDLKLQGISMIVTQRSEFTAAIKTKGIEKFIAGLKDSVAKMKEDLGK